MSERELTPRELELADELAELDRDYRPPADWQSQVWKRALRQQTASAQRSHRSRWPRWATAASITAAVVAASVLLGVWVMREQQHAEQRDRQQARIAMLEREQRKMEAEVIALEQEIEVLHEQQLMLNKQLEEVENEAERELIRKKLAAKAAEIAKVKRDRQRAKQARESKEREKIKVKCDPGDPLCGI